VALPVVSRAKNVHTPAGVIQKRLFPKSLQPLAGVEPLDRIASTGRAAGASQSRLRRDYLFVTTPEAWYI